MREMQQGPPQKRKRATLILEHKERLKVQEALLWGPYFKKKKEKQKYYKNVLLNSLNLDKKL